MGEWSGGSTTSELGVSWGLVSSLQALCPWTKSLSLPACNTEKYSV